MTRLDDTRFWRSSPLSLEYADIELAADALCATCFASGRLRNGCTEEVGLGDWAGKGLAESCDGRRGGAVSWEGRRGESGTESWDGRRGEVGVTSRAGRRVAES